MSLTFLGKKIGCSSLIVNDERICVTLLHIFEGHLLNKRVQTKVGVERNFNAVGFQTKSQKSVNKPQLDFYKKQNLPVCTMVQEFSSEYLEDKDLGHVYDIKTLEKLFEDHKSANITSFKTIGKGFAGVVKRYGFSGSPASHGTSLTERAHGSTGQQNSERVFKGKKMAGRMGGRKCTVRNIKLLSVDTVNNFVVVKGAVPGPKEGLLKIKLL